MKCSKSVIAISESVKSKLIELFHTGSKTTIIPNVLNCPSGDVVALRKPVKDFRFLVIANFDDKQKNISGIIDAFSMVNRKYPDASLTLAGNGEDFEKIKNRALKLNGGSSIIFLGSVPNSQIPDLYMQSDCYILNSNFETFSISTAEALLFGLPVIATRCNGPEEYVNDSNGILIEKNNPEALLNAMFAMIANKDRYNSHQIHCNMKEKYCKDLGMEFLRVYEEVLQLN